MKNFLVFAGNRFKEAEVKALELGYHYKNGELCSSMSAYYLEGKEDGTLAWHTSHYNIETIDLQDFLKIKNAIVLIDELEQVLRYCEDLGIKNDLENYGDFYHNIKQWIEEQ